ncbi:MAG: phytoene desaturase [Deltaproteobacteria bacterium]|nr:MAG: phytoene desaturase [Deltaproteobacteria bacterium]
MTTQTAIVIGSGLGGLAAAIRLRTKGYRTILLEANEQLGGRASVFKRDGFTYDAGPTVVTAPHLFEELFRMAGRDPDDYYEMVPVDPYYRVEFPDGSHFDYVGEEERILAQIAEMSPGDVDGYRKLAQKSHDIFSVGYDELVDQPFHELGTMLRAVPDMMRLGSYRSVYSMVSSYIRDERLRQVFTFQPLLIGGNPFDASSIYLLIHWLERKWGVWFPKGGTNAMVAAMGRLLEDIGVEVHLNAPVERIAVTNGVVSAVHTEGGQTFDCDLIVSNADPSVVYTKLIAPEHRRVHTDRNVSRKRQSMSLFVAYFGSSKPYPDVRHHTIIMGPRYRGLLRDIFHKRVLADDFSLYLHRPGWTDPTLAPEGKDGFYVLSPVPNQKSGIDWSKEAEPYWQRILDSLEKSHLPGIKDNLEHSFHIDPRYFEGKLRSMDGAAFGIEPVLTQSAWFRYHNKSPDVGGLFFVGASVHPGAGMPGVLQTAAVVDKLVPTADDPLALPGKKEPRKSA